MQIIKWRSSAECGGWLAIVALWEKVEIDCGRFSVMVKVQWGLAATSWYQQTQLCEESQ